MEGVFEIYYDNTSGERMRLWSGSFSLGPKDSGANRSENIELTYPTDFQTPDTFILVFRGKMGAEQDSVVGKYVSMEDYIYSVIITTQLKDRSYMRYYYKFYSHKRQVKFLREEQIFTNQDLIGLSLNIISSKRNCENCSDNHCSCSYVVSIDGAFIEEDYTSSRSGYCELNYECAPSGQTICSLSDKWTYNGALILSDGRIIDSAMSGGTSSSTTVCGESDSGSEDFAGEDLYFIANDRVRETIAFVYSHMSHTTNEVCSGDPWDEGVTVERTTSSSYNYFAVWVAPERIYQELLPTPGYNFASSGVSICGFCFDCEYPIILESSNNCSGEWILRADIDISKDQNYGAIVYIGRDCEGNYSIAGYLKDLQTGARYFIDTGNIPVETPMVSITITK